MAYWDNLKVTGQPGSRKAPTAGASTNHRGMDVIFPDGKVRPEVGGVVYYSGPMEGYGNIVVVKGDDGNFYHYAHNAANRVQKNQRVNPGEVIATMGSTGTSSGPHTHIEVTDSNGNNLHPQTRQSLGIGGNKLASQGFYGNPMQETSQTRPDLDVQRVYAPVPDILDPTGDVANISNQSLVGLMALAEQHRQQQEALSRDPRFDITSQMQQADTNLQGIQQQALPQINEQSYMNVMSPEEMKARADQANLENTIAEAQAQKAIDTVYGDYKNRRTSEQMGDYLTNQANAMNQQFINASPALQQYYQAQSAGVPQGLYNIDPAEIQRRINADNAYKAYMNSQMLTYSGVNPNIANAFGAMAQQAPSQAQQYLQQAEAKYQADIANKYGVPYQQLMDQSKAMQEYQKSYAPQLVAGQKEAMIQPEMNFRTVAEKVIPTAENMYQDKVTATNNYITALQNADKNYIKANEPGANMIGKITEQRGQLQEKQPQRVLDKYHILAGQMGSPTTPQMQGTTSLGTSAMTNVTKGVGDINKAQSDIYNTQSRELTQNEQNMINAYKAQYGSPSSAKPKPTEQELKAGDAEKVIKYIMSDVTGRPDPAKYGAAKTYLMATGRYNEEEVDAILQMAYTQATVNQKGGK